MEKKLYFDFNTTQKILNKIAWIDRFKGKWQAISSNDNQYLKELRRESVVASLVAYTRLGGANRSNKDIQKLLGTIQNSDLTSQKNRDIFGYSRILESIINNYHIICFDETYIYHIHSFLFKNTINDSEQSGTSKNHPYKVVAKYPDGQKRVIVTNSLCFSVKVEIYELFRWTIRAFKESHIHPLLIIALFVYEFLSIQPFHSGNGHISRLLTLFLLLKHGYSYFQYVSFEELIEKRKDEYQSALKKCQKERGEGKNEIIEKWAIFFIDCIFDLTAQFEEKFKHFESIGSYLNERQKRVLNVIKNRQPVRLADINCLLNNISINTIRKDLKYLVHEGILKKWGKNKGTVYSMIMNKCTGEVEY